ncbi:PREDICTED: chymotrypsin-2-like [Vollenhovia emeryi]|uniref:chymotrypsin-2-like n=1 Tax=Vollenhovia emeryi TaxID=411798 RepID=UPI0005F487B1|nr:PREDICTED: chymotrypsin-2-like [Vollenhovia emeryi]
MNTIAGLLVACLALTVYGLPGPQITGGTDARNGAYPYQVSLRTNDLDPFSHFCGGAIISEHYVITSAQCIYPYLKNPTGVYVAFGSIYLDGNFEANISIYHPMNLIVHAGYNNKLRVHDIGLIELFDPIEFNEDVQPIALPTADRNFDGYPLLATGWGRLQWGGPIPNRLQEIMLKGYPQELCSRYEYIKETHICTYIMEDKGICDGDEGGPVVDNNVLVGVMSFSHGSCGTGALDVSTRVFSYREWIRYYTGL